MSPDVLLVLLLDSGGGVGGHVHGDGGQPHVLHHLLPEDVQWASDTCVRLGLGRARVRARVKRRPAPTWAG